MSSLKFLLISLFLIFFFLFLLFCFIAVTSSYIRNHSSLNCTTMNKIYSSYDSTLVEWFHTAAVTSSSNPDRWKYMDRQEFPTYDPLHVLHHQARWQNSSLLHYQFLLQQTNKNSTYGRHWLSQRVRIIALCQNTKYAILCGSIPNRTRRQSTSPNRNTSLFLRLHAGTIHESNPGTGHWAHERPGNLSCDLKANERPQNKFRWEGTKIYTDIATLWLTRPTGPRQFKV